MKIVFILDSLNPGGAERVISVLANNWVKKDNEVTIFYLFPCMKLYDFNENIKIISLENQPKGRVAYRKSLRGEIFSEKPDMLISFLDISNILSCFILKPFSNLNLIISERNNPIYAKLFLSHKIRQKLFYRFADRVVFQTQRVKKFGIKYFHLKQNKCKVIHNPMRRVACLNTAPILKGKNIVTIGRLEKQKGFDLLLQAFSQINNKFPDWNLFIFGEGPERKELENLRDQLGLQNNVCFSGIEKDVFGIYKQADIYVLSSRYEGMPNVLMEAMASGCACAAFDCDYGPAELIDHEKNGLLVDNGNIEKLSESIEYLIKNPDKRKELGSAAVEKMQEFSESKIILQWENLIDNVINKKN